MAIKSDIAWTDSTWNPWIGCTKVSPGCANCYAEVLVSKRFGWASWGKGKPRKKTGSWLAPLKWNQECQPGHRVFVASLADIFDSEVDPTWLGEVLDIIRVCKNLRFLVLTKRIKEAAKRLPKLVAARGGWSEFRHLWLGCTAENQCYWDLRVPVLLGITGVAKTFVSVEPMLGPINPKGLKPGWIIVGGESGTKHRPIGREWPIPLRDWSVRNDIPFFFKQWGGSRPKKHGKLLEGVEWCQVPQT
jgi:protein gp37